jgi:hypothetical protein
MPSSPRPDPKVVKPIESASFLNVRLPSEAVDAGEGSLNCDTLSTEVYILSLRMLSR